MFVRVWWWRLPTILFLFFFIHIYGSFLASNLVAYFLMWGYVLVLCYDVSQVEPKSASCSHWSSLGCYLNFVPFHLWCCFGVWRGRNGGKEEEVEIKGGKKEPNQRKTTSTFLFYLITRQSFKVMFFCLVVEEMKTMKIESGHVYLELWSLNFKRFFKSLKPLKGIKILNNSNQTKRNMNARERG